MGEKEKATNHAQESVGRMKEAAGAITGNDDLKSDGKTDQNKAKAKGVGEDLKDALGKLKKIFSK